MKTLHYKLVTLAEVKSSIDINTDVAVDFETRGFYGKILLAQFYQRHWDTVLIVRSPEILELSAVLKPLKFVAHNINYEVSTLQAQLGEVFATKCFKWAPYSFHDTLLLGKLQYWQKESHSLDKCYTYMLGFDPYEAHNLDKKTLQKSDFTNPNEAQLTYAALDVFYLLDLLDACKTWQDSQCYQLDVLATAHAFNFQTNGFAIDAKRIKERIKENNQKISDLAVPINVNSWQQVRPYIGEPESDGYHLALYTVRDGNERAKAVQTSRKLIKENSFLTKYLEESFEGRIFGKFAFITKSGRGNCNGQNLQQLPRSTKTMFSAPEGRVLVLSDFAQLELRYVCALVGEIRMSKMFKDGHDLHDFVKDLMEVERQYAKTCNFNLVYGGSANMLQSIFLTTGGAWLELSFVKELKAKWSALWPELIAWQTQVIKDWKAKKPLCTLLGRKMKAKLYTDALNLPVQGGSTGDISKLALHKMLTKVENLPDLKDRVLFVNFIHDSFMWECDNDPVVYKKLAQITAESMQEAWTALVSYTLVPDLPMPVDVQVGLNWGDIEYEIEKPIYTLNLEG